MSYPPFMPQSLVEVIEHKYSIAVSVQFPHRLDFLTEDGFNGNISTAKGEQILFLNGHFVKIEKGLKNFSRESFDQLKITSGSNSHPPLSK